MIGTKFSAGQTTPRKLAVKNYAISDAQQPKYTTLTKVDLRYSEEREAKKRASLILQV